MPFLDGIHDGDPVDALSSLAAWHHVQLTGVRRKSAWLRARGALVRTEPGGGVTVADLPGDRDTWWANAPKNLRATIRKRRAKARRRGELVVTTATSVPDVAAAFDRFVAMESMSWKAASGYTLAQQPAVSDGLRSFVTAAAPFQRARIRILHVGELEAAFQVEAVVGSTLFMLKTAYDESIAELSPGQLLMAEIVETACDDPAIDRLDYCVAQPWQQHWGMRLEPTYEVDVFNRVSVRGWAMRAERQVAAGQ